MKKGFTLIELVIVIAILAILAAVVVLTLNPAQLMAQARDSQRISDLGSVKSAIALYLATAASPAITAGPYAMASTTCEGFSAAACTLRASTTVDGTGWVAINFNNTTGGSPLSALPADPTNSATYQYAYKGDATNLVYKITGKLESQKYAVAGGPMSTDGGNNTSLYELGTNLGL
ncbi:MAG: type II secretion system protein [Candidatus Paceibacterota bacterium]